MALIKDLQEVRMDRNRVHGVTETTYCVFTDDRGQKYLQIDTYGSPQRQITGVKSQTVQLGAEAIGQLRAIIARHFPQGRG